MAFVVAAPALLGQQRPANAIREVKRAWRRPQTAASSTRRRRLHMYVPSSEIREKFISFFESKQHKRLPSASLIPDDPTILLTIAGMVPFKPIFLGLETASVPRATSCQKCIRTNDVENVGVTKRHHTFFEMLGNFSFGDYFKREAIQWAWELLTQVYNFPAERLAVSVFNEDEESYELWRDFIGVPEERIQRMGEEDNFWSSGPTGPCGPSTEIYYDFRPEQGGGVNLEDDERYIELYNLVFMQFSRDASGQLSPLAKKNIDTGMGLERVAQVLQEVPNNYETDLMRPIIDEAAKLAKVGYDEADDAQKTSLKVIGDHMRAATHLIADGVRASNVGRGYVLRRLVRRIVRHGRLLNLREAFVERLLPVTSRLAVEAGYANVEERVEAIRRELAKEEGRFLATLDRGEARLEEVLANSVREGQVKGDDAFELYDTFGFPLELTDEAAAEKGLHVDHEQFEARMEEQRQRARSARGQTDLTSGAEIAELARRFGNTKFTGYDATSAADCEVMGIVLSETGELVEEAEQGSAVQLILRSSPFYAEGGGQVGDIGDLDFGNGTAHIEDVRRHADATLHFGRIASGVVAVGDRAEATVDAARRKKIRAHHTATHLLQAALKRTLKREDISQAGSLVDDDRLRFDFNCSRALTPEELTDIETLINQWIAEERKTSVQYMTLDDAVKNGAVAMFGEKYDKAEVRVVDVPGVSMELCGGTHVGNTSDIGLFKIISESGIAAGVRRIEAVCGVAVLPYLSSRDNTLKSLCGSLKVKAEELVPRVTTLQDELKSQQKVINALRSKLAVQSSNMLLANVEELNGYHVLTAKLDSEADSDALKTAAERLAQKLGQDKAAIVLASSGDNGKVSFVALAGKQVIEKGVHAGKLVGLIAKMCKGGGGGRPNFAQAGGKDAEQIPAAIKVAKEELREKLTVQ